MIAADGSVLEHGAPPAQWDALVAEAAPGDPAPRPYLIRLGPDGGAYRVGPIAQLRVGAVTGARASAMQERWLEVGGGLAARAVLAVHSVEAVAELLRRPALVGGPVGEPVPVPEGPDVGVGWVDGPRGLLVHRYCTDGTGRVARATVLTPTAQNEPWLAGLLTGTATWGADVAEAAPAMERAIREADPCLPCTSAPAGAMGVVVTEVEA
ncbi:MAG TPA: hypothetical protein PKB06_06515 [Actinotalea sp.]|nr:hypothetical protein [Actinotalea sp.]